MSSLLGVLLVGALCVIVLCAYVVGSRDRGARHVLPPSGARLTNLDEQRALREKVIAARREQQRNEFWMAVQCRRQLRPLNPPAQLRPRSYADLLRSLEQHGRNNHSRSAS